MQFQALTAIFPRVVLCDRNSGGDSFHLHRYALQQGKHIEFFPRLSGIPASNTVNGTESEQGNDVLDFLCEYVESQTKELGW